MGLLILHTSKQDIIVFMSSMSFSFAEPSTGIPQVFHHLKKHINIECAGAYSKLYQVGVWIWFLLVSLNSANLVYLQKPTVLRFSFQIRPRHCLTHMLLHLSSLHLLNRLQKQAHWSCWNSETIMASFWLIHTNPKYSYQIQGTHSYPVWMLLLEHGLINSYN